MKRPIKHRPSLRKPTARLAVGFALIAFLSACGPLPDKWYSSDAATQSRGFFKILAHQRTLRGGPVVASKGSLKVQPGDTYYKISMRYKVPLRALLEVNKARPPYRLKAGSQIKLPVQAFHTVRAKETLYAISRKYNTDVSTLATMNNIAKPFGLQIGQKLQVPNERRGRVAGLSRNAPQAKAATAAIKTPSKKPVLPAAPRRVGRFQVPVQGRVISGFGTKANGLHNDGINIAARQGAPIKAAENGVVVYAGNELRGYGNLLLVRHGEGWVTAYAHASKFLVKPGDRVKQGQSIAEVGQTGNVDQPQVHFEVRKGTRAVNPKSLI